MCFRSEKWRINCRGGHLDHLSPKQLHTKRLCSAHFESSQFTNHLKNRLIWNAVPTLFDVPNPPQQLSLKRKKRKIDHSKDHEISAEKGKKKYQIVSQANIPSKIPLKKSLLHEEYRMNTNKGPDN